MADRKIAFLGAGKMASVMVQGLIGGGIRLPGELACAGGPGGSGPALAAATGIEHEPDLPRLLAGAGAVVVAFKPQHLTGADPRIAELTGGKLVISVLAGKTLAALARVFPQARNIVRTMPNTPGRIGAGITGFCSLHVLDAEDHSLVGSLLDALGRSLEFPEAMMDAVTAVSGSGPAYVFEFLAALAEAAVAAGLPAAQARELALETVLGAARLAARTGQVPESLRDEVTSPNGTTAAGLRQMEQLGFRHLIRESVLAAKRRSEELSRA
jgi:pyrroline-5-carboxylate reductase